MPSDPGSISGDANAGTASPKSTPVLDLTRPYTQRVPDSSVANVRRVAVLDGRTRIIAARRPGAHWHRMARRTRFTREDAALLRAAGVSEVVLHRCLARASFPLAWLPTR